MVEVSIIGEYKFQYLSFLYGHRLGTETGHPCKQNDYRKK